MDITPLVKCIKKLIDSLDNLENESKVHTYATIKVLIIDLREYLEDEDLLRDSYLAEQMGLLESYTKCVAGLAQCEPVAGMSPADTVKKAITCIEGFVEDH